MRVGATNTGSGREGDWDEIHSLLLLLLPSGQTETIARGSPTA